MLTVFFWLIPEDQVFENDADQGSNGNVVMWLGAKSGTSPLSHSFIVAAQAYYSLYGWSMIWKRVGEMTGLRPP
jgi:hypothetical protein